MTGVLSITTNRGERVVDLAACLDAAAEERAQVAARAWIKALRHLRVDGTRLRSRFCADGDSLWWFTELYLHKQQTILTVMRSIAACDAIFAERPTAIRWLRGDPVSQFIAGRRAASHGIPASGTAMAELRLRVEERRVRMRARMLRLASSGPRPARRRVTSAKVLAFVHRAFVNADAGAAAGERYIGRVLREIEHATAPGTLEAIAVGPRRNFRARRWWDPLVRRGDDRLIGIDAIAGRSSSSATRSVWASRSSAFAALTASEDVRTHAIIDGTDCWPIVQLQIAGVVWLQWPWSARAMDQAGRALDAVRPDVCVTYAEAGGWGRALALACRRRGIPLAGIQHGFIYRHWLNYLHEPDEIAADPENPLDRGFPVPAMTLVFDRYAEQHLINEGHFPPRAVRVVGSPERDELERAAATMSAGDQADARRRAGAHGADHLLLCATKFSEAKAVLPYLAAAVRGIKGVHLAIKPHPAETNAAYAGLAGGNISILSTTEPLAPLLAAARVVVTVNSTVAIDALALDVPGLTIGTPNNLSPFVDAGAMLGANTAEEIAGALIRLVEDDDLRASCVRRGRALIGGAPHGLAARRSAAAILDLAAGRAAARAEPGAC